MRGQITAAMARVGRRDAGQSYDPLLEAPELNETAQVIARGRELVKQAQRLREEADRQIEGAQATIEQSGHVLDRSQQLLAGKPDD